MTMNIHKAALTGLIALALGATLGCSADTDKAAAPAPAASPATSGVATTVLDAAGGKGVQDAILAQIIPGVEGAFKKRNAKARWEGNVMHVKMDGDTSKSMAGFTDCRVLSHLLKDDQTAVLEFPNGKILCTDVLKD